MDQKLPGARNPLTPTLVVPQTRRGGNAGNDMNRWRLMIVAASAVAALAVGLTAHAGPAPDDLSTLFAAINF